MTSNYYYFLDPAASDYADARTSLEAQQKEVYPTGNRIGERVTNDNSEVMLKADMTGQENEDVLRAISQNNSVIEIYDQSRYREVHERLDDPKWQSLEMQRFSIDD